MRLDRNTGLVLEGGGMRGVFTCGVLDAFMKNGLYFNYVVPVSAGACNGLSYMSRQIRRARISNIDFLARYKYIGLRHLVTQGCIFDQKLTRCSASPTITIRPNTSMFCEAHSTVFGFSTTA